VSENAIEEVRERAGERVSRVCINDGDVKYSARKKMHE